MADDDECFENGRFIKQAKTQRNGNLNKLPDPDSDQQSSTSSSKLPEPDIVNPTSTSVCESDVNTKFQLGK